jgi:hypothetical protein
MASNFYNPLFENSFQRFVTTMKKSINFTLRHGSEEFEIISRKGCAFLMSNGISGEAAETQMMILWRLIIKGEEFNNSPSDKTGITICLMVENKMVTMEVMKPVEESSFLKLDELDMTIQSIRGGHEIERYLKLIKPSVDLGSCIMKDMKNLELERIAYETGADIDFYVNENNILKLSAVRSFI